MEKRKNYILTIDVKNAIYDEIKYKCNKCAHPITYTSYCKKHKRQMDKICKIEKLTNTIPLTSLL